MFEYKKILTPKTIEYAQTNAGMLRGFCHDGTYCFFDVQYGEAKRWQTATPVKPWKGIKNAVQFGERMFPAQKKNFFTPWDSCGAAHELYPYTEFPFNLNIWSPSLDKNAKKPVMVWIHGGGYGSGCDMEMQCHDGEALSKFGDVVMVGLNHRLNIFGFMDCSRFGEKYQNSGNCGMSDLVLALKWIHENIENFGGDPNCVMIYGQSGGGGKVRALLQIPEAAGLFQKAVIMSGSGRRPAEGKKVDETNDLSNRVLDLLLEKYNTTSIETLEDLTPEELLDAMNEVAPKVGGVSPVSNMISWHPIANDWYPGDVYNVGISEHGKKIPVMIGCTISEMPLMRVFNKHEKTEAEQMAILKEVFPDQDVDKLACLFKKAWPNNELTDAIEIQGALGGRLGVIDYADFRVENAEAPTYTYLLAHDFPQEGGRGAWHCADIPMVFRNSRFYPENFHEGILDGKLEDAVCSSWLNFCKYGNPSNEFLPEWPAYKAGECAVMVLDNKSEVKYDFDRELNLVRESMKLCPTDKYSKNFVQIVN